MVVYNEINPYAAEWLRNLGAAELIEPGDICETDVRVLDPNVVRGARQFHAFAGIGVWSYALRLAGWPAARPVWTGSCPCQPFSQAGRKRGVADERHLWPAWRRLLVECRPPIVFGEQVASPDGRSWLDAVRADLEALDYAFGAADLCAAGVGAPHVRPRLFFVAVDWLALAAGTRRKERARGTEFSVQVSSQPDGQSAARGLEDAHVQRRQELGLQLQPGQPRKTVPKAAGRGQARGLGDANSARGGRDPGAILGPEREGQGQRFEFRHIPHELVTPGTTRGFWFGADWVYCQPEPRFPLGSYRPVEPGSFPLAHGVAGRVAVRRASGPAEEEHWYNRRAALEAVGNAIVPQVAATFVRAVMGCLGIAP